MCLNVNHKGVSCVDSLCSLLSGYRADLIAMSEADVPHASRSGLRLQWQRLGFHTVFSSPEPRGSRVMLLSLEVDEASSRYAAAWLDYIDDQGRSDAILVVALYLQSSCRATAQRQLAEIVAGVHSLNCKALLFGDFNLVQSEDQLASFLQQGIIHAADEVACGSPLPATGPVVSGARRRRIDFALTCGGLFPSSLDHGDETLVGPLSDHLVVRYSFDLTLPMDNAFNSFNASAFHQRLARGDLDAAWAALSGLAEDMLALTDIQPRECPRGQIWSPVRRAPSTRRGVCDPMASPSLQALRKLLTRLEVWRSRPWDVALRRRILASLGRIRMLLPEFPFFAAVDDRLCDVARETATLLAEQEKLVRLQRWKEVTRNDPVRIRSFVKQRADMAVEWASVPPPAHSTPAGWHPAVAVQKAACDWTAQWSREALNDYASVDSILAGVSRPLRALPAWNLTLTNCARPWQL